MKNRNKTSVFFIILTMALVLATGCTGTDTPAAEATEQSGGEAMSGKENGMAVSNLTEDEKRLLTGAFGEEKRIEEGRLFSYQREALDQLRAGESYLKERYPDRDFQIQSLSPADRFRSWAEIRFKDSGSPLCLVKVFPLENGTVFRCEDNFYGYLVEENYDAMIEQILEETGCPARAYTVFLSTAGEGLPAEPSVEELLAFDPNLRRQTALYVSGSVPDESIRETVQKTLLEKKLYGDYWIYFTGGDITGDIRDLEAEKGEWDSLLFSCIMRD